MRIFAPLTLIVAAFLSLTPVCHAQMPGKAELEAIEAAAALIGAPVFAVDGAEVGTVANVLFNEQGNVARLKMNVASHLGFGTRRVEIPRGAYTVSRGTVVLELPAEAVRNLPELLDGSHETCWSLLMRPDFANAAKRNPDRASCQP